MVDYAQHLIRIDTLAREAHAACTKRDWVSAKLIAASIAAESRLLAVTADARSDGDELQEANRKK
jgi:hypothetical protein